MCPQKPKQKKWNAAQRMFHHYYLPYIQQWILENAQISYLTADQITEKWGKIIPWDTKFANEIVFRSKIFFKQTISPDSQNMSNPEFLEDVTNQIIEHLMVYFMCAPQYKNAENAAREYLFKKLNTESAFLAHARVRHENIMRARERRIAARAAAKAQVAPDPTPVAPRPKRQRIPIIEITDGLNVVRHVMRINIENQK